MKKTVEINGTTYTVRPLGVRKLPALYRLQHVVSRMGGDQIGTVTDDEWDSAIETVRACVDGATVEQFDDMTFAVFVELVKAVMSAAREEAESASAPFSTATP